MINVSTWQACKFRVLWNLISVLLRPHAEFRPLKASFVLLLAHPNFQPEVSHGTWDSLICWPCRPMGSSTLCLSGAGTTDPCHCAQLLTCMLSTETQVPNHGVISPVSTQVDFHICNYPCDHHRSQGMEMSLTVRSYHILPALNGGTCLNLRLTTIKPSEDPKLKKQMPPH